MYTKLLKLLLLKISFSISIYYLFSIIAFSKKRS